MKISKPQYLEKALLLSAAERERVLSRMSGKLPRRLEKDKLSVDDALAIQLEIEDEQLNEWREKMRSLKGSKKEAKLQAEVKPAVPSKPRTPSKDKTVAPAATTKAPAKTTRKPVAVKSPAVEPAPTKPAAPKTKKS